MTEHAIYDVARKLARNINGFTTTHPDLTATGFSFSAIANTLEVLTKRGEIYKAKISYRKMRFFGTAALAEDCVAREAKDPNVVINKASLKGAVIYPANIKITIGKPFTPRWTGVNELAPLLKQTPWRRT